MTRLPARPESRVPYEPPVKPISRAKWGKQFSCCVICMWMPELGHRYTLATDTHEIARGPHRSKAKGDPAAWLRVCRECHEKYLPGMPIARQLAYKAIQDLENYNRVTVNRLRALPDDSVTEVDVLRELLAIEEEF